MGGGVLFYLTTFYTRRAIFQLSNLVGYAFVVGVLCCVNPNRNHNYNHNLIIYNPNHNARPVKDACSGEGCGWLAIEVICLIKRSFVDVAFKSM